MKNNNRNNSLEKLWQASKVPHEHTFNNYYNCGTEWCFETRSSKEVDKYNNKDGVFCCKENNKQLYNLQKKTSFMFQIDKILG